MLKLEEFASQAELASFDNYRDFLRARFDQEKKKNPRFSNQYCAMRIGVARSYLIRVIQKERHITVDKVFPVSRLFKLNEVESQYFLFLFLRETTNDPAARVLFDSIVSRIRAVIIGVGAPSASLDDLKRDLPFHTQWLKSALWSLVSLKDFRYELDWIRSKLGEPSLSVAEITEAWKELIDSGNIRSIEGRFEAVKVPFYWVDPIDPVTDSVFRPILEKTIRHLKPDGRPFARHQLVLTLNPQDRDRVELAYREFQEKLLSIAEQSKDPDSVFLVSNHFFQISERTESGLADQGSPVEDNA